ncbi:MAG: polyketide cyclase [Acidobacteria bacterium]|nr:MAG: polyketide cyclase [Acidobacteriota bacterium]
MGKDGVERVSITIDAPIDVVWSVFTDVERWPTWASSFTSVELIDGPMRFGAKARIRQPRLPTLVWEVTKWSPGHSWTWTATSPGARTEASHVLTRSGEGTLAEQSITSSGPLGRVAAFLWRSVTRRYLAIEAAGLKQQSERVAATSRVAAAVKAS